MALKLKICKLNDGLTPEPEPEGVNFVSSERRFHIYWVYVGGIVGADHSRVVRSRVTQEESKFVGTIRV